jgi:hypothetical protein
LVDEICRVGGKTEKTKCRPSLHPSAELLLLSPETLKGLGFLFLTYLQNPNTANELLRPITGKYRALSCSLCPHKTSDPPKKGKTYHLNG